MKTLQQILQEHGTDKEIYHSYGPVYEKLFAPIRKQTTEILEIGVFQGQSLRAWKEYFPNAWILGIDKFYECMLFNEERIHTLCVDATYPKIIHRILALNKNQFDIIIDDGSHDIADQLVTKAILWRVLRTGGFYIIEDIQNSGLATVLFEQDPNLIQIYRGSNSKDDTLVIFQKR